MPVPRFTISADGVDVTSRIAGAGLLAMTIVDGEGLASDRLQLTIDNVDATVRAPRTGVVLRASGGYADRMRDFGAFVVDRVSYTGWPQVITVEAKSLAAKSLAKQREPKGYPPDDYPTYGDIFESVASRIGLTLRMDDSLRNISNSYDAQTDESGVEFVTRVAEKLNAAVSVKSGNMVVVPKGAGTGASGGSLDAVLVAPSVNLLAYSVTMMDERKHGEVAATYYDRDRNVYETETAQTGMEGPQFLMRAPFQNQDEAKRAAEAQAKELARLQAEATFDIVGDPYVQAGAWASVSGVHPDVDGSWPIRTATHQFSAAGAYAVSLTCGAASGEG